MMSFFGRKRKEKKAAHEAAKNEIEEANKKIAAIKEQNESMDNDLDSTREDLSSTVQRLREVQQRKSGSIQMSAVHRAAGSRHR